MSTEETPENDGRIDGPAPLPLVVGVSATSGSPAALRWGLSEARLRGLPLVALRAYSVPSPAGTVRPTPSRASDAADIRRDAALSELKEHVAAAIGDALRPGEISLRAERGTRRSALLRASWSASLLVVDAPRRRSIGSSPIFASSLVQRAGCPVVVMPPHGPEHV